MLQNEAEISSSVGSKKDPPLVAIENRKQTRQAAARGKSTASNSKSLRTSQTRSSVVSSRTSKWDSLNQKSTTLLRQTATPPSTSSKDKDDLIQKLKKQVDQLQRQQQDSKLAGQQQMLKYEEKLVGLKQRENQKIQQLSLEREEMRAKLIQSQENLRVMEVKQEQAFKVTAASITSLQTELAQAQDRIQVMEKQKENVALADSRPCPRAAADVDHLSNGEVSGDLASIKLKELRTRRQSTETNLKNMVLESQNSPLHVQTVIVNLQDELEASRQVIFQQKAQVQKLIDLHEGVGEKEFLPGEDRSDWKLLFQKIQTKHIQLQHDRAWGEFNLRNRITNDSLKFHRRLVHWKGMVQALERKVQVLREVQPCEFHDVENDDPQGHKLLIIV